MSRSSSSDSNESNSSSAKRRHRSGKDRRSKRRSRSRSPDDYKRSTKQRSKGHEMKDSSSYSDKKGRRYQRTRSRSRDKSWTKETSKRKVSAETSYKNPSLTSAPKSNEDQLKQKMQLALQAAANADAQLREQGILTAKPKEWGRYSEQDRSQSPPKIENLTTREPPLSVKEQMDRAKIIDEINSSSFSSASFVTGMAPLPQIKESNITLDNHDSAMFSLSDPNIPTCKPQVTKNYNVAHENLFANIALKEEKWIRKLFLMRQRKLNGEAMI